MKLIECPRDAMQGLESFIPTSDKIRYLNQLLQVGFDTLDAGSFVSPKAIPQLRDTALVLDSLNWQNARSKILAIVANLRGATEACQHEAVTFVGFPLSVSETFQQRNTRMSIPEALNELNDIQEICIQRGKILVTYLSMGFGNPYGDPYSVESVGKFVEILQSLEVTVVSLSDTIGVSTPDQIRTLFTQLTKDFPSLEIGVHLHSSPMTSLEKIAAALDAGCQRFDGALLGIGGCPMANDQLVGNISTESILSLLDERKIPTGINRSELSIALAMANGIFSNRR